MSVLEMLFIPEYEESQHEIKIYYSQESENILIVVKILILKLVSKY